MNERYSEIHKVIKRLLIANRGEPAMRAIRTCRMLGIESSVIYFGDDAASDWVRAADYAHRLSSRGGAAENPYMDAEQIIRTALENGCQAIWPGWGFLSEDFMFARGTDRAGLIWVGPSEEAIRVLGSKSESSNLARECGFQTIPEISIKEGQILVWAPLKTHDKDGLSFPRSLSLQSVSREREFRENTGSPIKELGDDNLQRMFLEVPASDIRMDFPAIIKPVLGGGGKGQVVVQSEVELRSRIEEVSRQAKNLYGNGDLAIQRYLKGARHIELQIICDGFSSPCILGARDCSIQRRNQKIIEEAPPLLVDQHLFEGASLAAKKLFEMAGYSSAGTIEMLLYEGHLYFLEVNTRLQVEHTVTEESLRISTADGFEKLDILAEMLGIASGNRLTFSESDVRPWGYSIEARIYAEDPDESFMPTPGRVCFVKFPAGDGIRVDTAIVGPEVTVSKHFDPMLAKIISSASTREKAVQSLVESLSNTIILGIKTNIDFLRRIAIHPNFQKGGYHTGFISEAGESLACSKNQIPLACSIAAIITYVKHHRESYAAVRDSGVVNLEDALSRLAGSRIEYNVRALGMDYACEVGEWNENRYAVRSGESWLLLDVDSISQHILAVRGSDGKSYKTFLHATNGKCQIVIDGEYYSLNVSKRGSVLDRKDEHAAPYGGRIIKICVKADDEINAGDDLYVLEAMKMESRVRATRAGRVRSILLAAGDAVEAGESVVIIDSDYAEGDEPIHHKTLDFSNPKDPMNMIFPMPRDLSRMKDELNAGWEKHSEMIAVVPELYFKGYDISADSASAAFESVLANCPERANIILSDIAHYLVCGIKLREDDAADDILDLIKNPGRTLDETDSLESIAEAMRRFGVSNVNNKEEVGRALPRILTWIKNTDPKRLQIIVEMVEKSVAVLNVSNALTSTIKYLAGSGIYELENELKGRLLSALRIVDANEYYKIIMPPVALSYLDEYEMHRSKPHFNLSDAEIAKMRECSQLSERSRYEDDFSSMPRWLGLLLERWFEGFIMKGMEIGKGAKEAGVNLYELRNEQNPKERRLVAIALIEKEEASDDGGKISLPNIERAGIEAYRSIAQYEAFGTKYPCNHVFIVPPSDLVFPWRQTGSEGNSFSPQRISDISSRIAGFARDIHVGATEVILNLERDEGVLSHLLEIRHVDPAGVINRPPYPITERIPELMKGAAGQLDDKQHRLGKLLNEDRARILFDDSEYEEMFFPEVDIVDGPPVGLKVFRGKIGGIDSMAYAGDFRIRGGALGEREGKKLASAVVLAYVSRMPLLGIHDGAGADICGSVASLGWAGAYFGAIANTGGFSNEVRFWDWFKGHHGRAYFEKVLGSFGFKEENSGKWVATASSGCRRHQSRFMHLHLNLGATVGMLVYGAAISAMSIMADRNQAYRVLTGSETVKRITGERASNYELGGAKVHSLYSGDIDVDFRTEEEVLECARKLIPLFVERRERASSAKSVAVKGPADPTIDKAKIMDAMDHETFFETRSKLKGTSKLLTGYGAIDGVVVGIASSMSDYGLRNARSLKKLHASYAGCQEFGLPIILVAKDKWYGIPEGATADVMYARSECSRLFASLDVPRMTVAIGPRSLDAEIHQIADVCCYIPDGTESEYDINRANAMAHLQCQNISDSLHGISRLLCHLMKMKVCLEAGHQGPELSLPENYNRPYDIREFIGKLVDDGSFIEFNANDDQPLVVGLATVNNRAAGIIADNPAINSGAQTAGALGKFTMLNRLCERFSIPIIEFNDSPAFQPGSRQERLGIQGEGGKSLREECLGRVPKLAVTLRQNYGGRYIHANLKTLGPGREGLICEGARVGVMGAEGAIGILHGKKLMGVEPSKREALRQKLLAGYVETSLNPETAVKLGYAKRIVSLKNLRHELYEWIEGAHDRSA